MDDELLDESGGEVARRPYHHANLRQALIEAGLAILAEEGAEALTLRAAARRAGVSHNAPYRHFADKEALLAAIAEEGFVMLAAAVERASARFVSDPRQRLEEAGWAYIQFALTHPDHLRVMFGGMVPNPQAHAGLSSAGKRAFEQLATIIRDGQRAGAIVDLSERALAVSAWAMVHGLATLLSSAPIPPDVRDATSAEALARFCLRVQFDGLRRRPE